MVTTYCFYCPRCGLQSEAASRDEALVCGPCLKNDEVVSYLNRDYKAESVGFNGLAEMKRQREQGLDGLSGRAAQRDLFLPTAKELAKPGDRDGQKAIRDWAERHAPKETNTKPLYPEMEKRTF
jgi:hypothetical protein